MPNGIPEFEESVPENITAFFAQIADMLNEFASRHNLMTERYYHGSHCWMFGFRHPNGGIGSIDVMRESDETIKIYTHWWIDDFEKFARFLRTEETVEQEFMNLADVLEEQFQKILTWQISELTKVETDYEPYWKPYKKELQNYVEQYPSPKL